MKTARFRMSATGVGNADSLKIGESMIKIGLGIIILGAGLAVTGYCAVAKNSQWMLFDNPEDKILMKILNVQTDIHKNSMTMRDVVDKTITTEEGTNRWIRYKDIAKEIASLDNVIGPRYDD